MMHGLGDDKNPYKETVAVLEDLVCGYIQAITVQACSAAKRSSELDSDHILHVVRNDPKKYARVKELLSVNEVLKCARKAFDV
jgi:transcription initiation factor TFIID subunit 13